jgi:hypothetical protein
MSFVIALYNTFVTASCGDEEVMKHLYSSNLTQTEIIHCCQEKKSHIKITTKIIEKCI